MLVVVAVTYSFDSGTFFSVINIQLVKIVSITNVLNNECVNMRMAKRRQQLNGEKR